MAASNPIISSTLTERIRREATRLGFFKTGVTPARELPSGAEFEAWLRDGMQGQMHYMQRQKARRKSPGLVLESARSIIVSAMNYYSGDDLHRDPRKGRISRYAWGGDYHRIVEERLRQLRLFIERSAPGTRCVEYVDTGPVMEKAWGAQTALGWTGKHSNLITREQGSWFFIGVILTDVDLDYDEPERDFCGTCTRCIAACPTGAIVAPYVVDARLCISYLSIELRGAIPRPLRPLIGNRIFGCDDCQEVCPWNRFAVPTREPGFYARAGNFMPELSSLVRISRAQFEDRFRGSPIRRAKRDGFVRNVAVALGNSGDPDAVQALAPAVRDESALVRAHAAWGLGRLRRMDLLKQALAVEPDPAVIEEIQAALNAC